MKVVLLKSAILLISLSFPAFAQDTNLTVSQSPEFEQMLAEKRRVNPSITVNDKYKIQIYNGDSENSKKMLSDFKNQFKNYDGTIVFSTPSYKVWIGNFKSRIEAERNLAEIRKKYPNAFLVRPNK
ncbi:MAG TPA: SPOR domain-containing protein [Ohtaekwangia sp.]|nr:SPOR domain-containing protein [Ohtaekwangia sp.]